MLVFVRHAERGDNQFPKIASEISYDPPITAHSPQTILLSSSQLSLVFKKHEIRKIRMVSSKFLRCLMTAQGLIQNFRKEGFEIEQKLVIDTSISEYLKTDWFQEYPLKKLIYDDRELRGKYVKFESQWQEEMPQNITEKDFPENYVMFHRRIARFKQQLAFPESGTCTILITHGFVVRELCWRMNQIAKYSNQIKYCGYAVYQHDGHQEVLITAKL